MTHDNGALWELVEKWKLEALDRDTYNVDERSIFVVCYRELRSILERTVVAGESTSSNLVNEGLDYFYKVGDVGDKEYVSAIRRHIESLESMVRGKS